MNVPNLLTGIRFLLIPVFFLFYYSDMPNNVTVATFIFVLAGITDILDGYIARNYNMVTRWGVVFDPLADKLMLISVLFALTHSGYLPVWVIVVVAGKEAFMALGALLLYFTRDKTVVAANKTGKLATVLFYLSIVALVFELPYNSFLITIAVCVTVIAFARYAWNFKNIEKRPKT